MRKIFTYFLVVFLFLGLCGCASSKTNTQEWVITSETKNSLTQYFINGTSPGPLLEGKVGEMLTLHIKNETPKDVSIHWHGLLVPNNQDGVPDVTGPVIKAGKDYTYQFPILQSGSYWYHAHSTQEAEGLFGGILFAEVKDSSLPKSTEVIFSGDLGKSPEEVLESLVGGGESQNHSHKEMVAKSSMNMSGMDHSMMMGKDSPMDHTSMMNMGNEPMSSHYSDVSFARFLVNGESKPLVVSTKEKEVRLRVVNAYVDGFLNLAYSGGEFQVVASDGLPVKPITVSTLPIAMGETYDILLPLKEGEAFELVSFFMGKENSFSKVIVGQGTLLKLPDMDYKNYPYKPIYPLLETQTPSFISQEEAPNSPKKELDIDILGDHEKYDWRLSYKGEKLTHLKVKEGESVTFNLTNKTMMPHPMHLHGHFFKVLGLGAQEKPLYKHTINIESGENMKLQMVFSKEGKWLFHCHNLFHMARGLEMVIEVEK